MTREITADQKQRKSHLEWVPLGSTTVSLQAQGQFRPAHAESIAAKFDLEALGFPVVSKRADGLFYIIDGQHRIGGAKLFGFADDDKLQMEVYEGLTEAQEAELFLERNTVKPKSAWDKFHVAVTAGRMEEVVLERLVRAQGLTISPSRGEGRISCVNTLRKMLQRQGPESFSRTVRIVRDSFGDAGLDAPVLEGIGMMIHRYDGLIDEEALIERFQNATGGLNALMVPAAKLKATIGHPIQQCVAASAVGIYNRKASKKLAPWWKE